MKYRKIPGTHLEVSSIGFGLGAMALNRWSHTSDVKAHHLLRYALDRGINFFDTSDSEASGRGENLLGEAFHDDRGRVVLATKVGYSHEGLNFSPKHIKTACEESLKRLRTDRIDLYQVHHPPLSAIERDDLFKTLKFLQKQGKIVLWGICLEPSQNWFETAELSMRFRKARTVQADYHLLSHPLGSDLLTAAEKMRYGWFKKGCGVFAHWSPKALNQIEPELGRSFSEAATKYILQEGSLTSAIIEIDEEDQINELAMACESPELSEEEGIILKRIFDNYYETQKAMA